MFDDWWGGLNPTHQVKPKKPKVYVSLEEYCQALREIPMVFQVHVLYDNRPEEVTIRADMVKGANGLHPEIVEESLNKMDVLFENYRIENCKEIEFIQTYVDVIR